MRRVCAASASCWQLPAAAIARRFGPATSLYLQRLCGATAIRGRHGVCRRDLSRALRVPESKCAIRPRMLFPLQRLLLEFQGYLRARDCAVQRFTARVRALSPCLAAASPSACPRRARERRSSCCCRGNACMILALPAAVSALRLEALEFTAAAIGSAARFLRQ